METFQKFSVIPSGGKASSAVEAGINLTPTITKFSLNALAVKLMGLVSGVADEDKNPNSSVSIIIDEDSRDRDNKFYICKGLPTNAAKVAAVKTKNGISQDVNFTLAMAYSRILLAAVKNDTETVAVSKERLRLEGLAKGGTCLKKVYAKLESIGTHVIDGESRELFRMYDFMTSDHTPKTVKE